MKYRIIRTETVSYGDCRKSRRSEAVDEVDADSKEKALENFEGGYQELPGTDGCRITEYEAVEIPEAAEPECEACEIPAQEHEQG